MRGPEKGGDMGKKQGIFLAAVFLVICSCAAAALAEGNPNAELKAKLDQIQAQKEQTAREYEAAVNRANADADNKVSQLKRDYKKACRECAKERDGQCAQFRADYEAKMQPLRNEEKQVIAAMAPSQRMNFAKPKYERQQEKQ